MVFSSRHIFKTQVKYLYMKGSKRESVFQTYHVDGTDYWLVSVFNKDLKKKGAICKYWLPGKLIFKTN